MIEGDGGTSDGRQSIPRHQLAHAFFNGKSFHAAGIPRL